MNDQGAARKQSQGTESGQIIIKMRQCVAAKGNIKIGSYFVKKFFHRVVLPSFIKAKSRPVGFDAYSSTLVTLLTEH